MRSLSLLVCLALAGPLASAAHADPPEAFRYQGTILTLQGAPVADGVHDFHVRIYDAATGGSLLFDADVSAPVQGGAYSLLVAPDPGDEGALYEAFNEGPRFIEIEVLAGPGGAIHETLLPRQEITAVPYALNAGSSQSFDPGTMYDFVQKDGHQDIGDSWEEVSSDDDAFSAGVNELRAEVAVPSEGHWDIVVHASSHGFARGGIEGTLALLLRVEHNDGSGYVIVDHWPAGYLRTKGGGGSHTATIHATERLQRTLVSAENGSSYRFSLWALEDSSGTSAAAQVRGWPDSGATPPADTRAGIPTSIEARVISSGPAS